MVEEKETELLQMKQVFLMFCHCLVAFHPALCLDLDVHINDMFDYVVKLLCR